MRTVIEQWAPRKGYVRRQLPSGGSDSWSPTNSVVAQYIRHLSFLKIEDPTDASYFYNQAISLRDAYQKVAVKQNEEATIQNRLALGEITAEEASKLLAKAPTQKDSQEKIERERQMISNAVRSSYSMSVRAIHNFGEEKWVELLRPLVKEAHEAQDQERWEALHGFAGLLRDPGLAGLAMIALSHAGTREFDETWRYTVGRPDLYHHWRRAHAEESDNIAILNVGQTIFAAIVVKKGPHPTVRDIDPSWEPGLYSAAEVMKITDAILNQQQEAQVETEVQVTEGLA